MFTGSKQLFDVITKSSSTTEMHLMIDVAAVREAYHLFEISKVILVGHISEYVQCLYLCKTL